MYHYSKQRGRATLSPKDNHLFGPQFSLQASATAVTERPAKPQGILGSRDAIPVKTHEGGTNSPAPKRSASSQHSSEASYGQATERPSSLHAPSQYRDANPNNHHQAVAQQHSLRSSTISKRQMLPASTAYAHDLANSPDSNPPDEDARNQGYNGGGGGGANNKNTNRILKPPVYLPGDRVVFAENPSSPGVPIVYRTVEERSANPDRLNLDRRRLMVCPILEGEEQLRLLNYQHNMISRIEHLNGLRRLIFLDLYDNQIEEISGLHSLKSLRVLMLGKNRIRRIENLDVLTKLDVLDLHGNQIMKIENLNHLTELRVLNLAGNLIEHVDNLAGMDALTELNLRRNRIRTVGDADMIPNLQRLFLSFNEISCFEDISCLADAQSLTELSLDGNPFSSETHYKQAVLRRMLQLRQLDMKRITEDERRIASVMAKKEDEKKRESNKIAVMKELFLDPRLRLMACKDEKQQLHVISKFTPKVCRELAITNAALRWYEKLNDDYSVLVSPGFSSRPYVKANSTVKHSQKSTAPLVERRRLAISNARHQWEVMQCSVMSRTNKLIGNATPDLVANHVGNVPNHDYSLDDREDTESSRSRSPKKLKNNFMKNGLNSRPTSAKSTQSDREWSATHPLRPSSTGVCRSASLTRGGTPEQKEKITLSGPIDSNASINVDYLAELEGDTLSLYGAGALDALDKNWGIAAAGAVTVVSFKFIDFDEISKHLHKVRARFPSVHTLSFNSTNIYSLAQFNALSAVRRIDHLIVDPEGNAITLFPFWRNYVLFRLAHFSLKKINDTEVSAADIVNAEKFFGPLAHITTSQLPQSRLVSLLGETKKKQLLALSDEKFRKSQDLRQLSDRTSSESVGRAGLIYTSPDTLQQKAHEQKGRRDFVHTYITELTRDAVMVDQKRNALRQMWPQIVSDMVESAIVEMWDHQSYMKKCLEDLSKEKS